MANNHSATERRLWDAADEFRANSDLKSSEYATPVLGLVFLRYAEASELEERIANNAARLLEEAL